jgi:hypothetical protein
LRGRRSPRSHHRFRPCPEHHNTLSRHRLLGTRGRHYYPSLIRIQRQIPRSQCLLYISLDARGTTWPVLDDSRRPCCQRCRVPRYIYTYCEAISFHSYPTTASHLMPKGSSALPPDPKFKKEEKATPGTRQVRRPWRNYLSDIWTIRHRAVHICERHSCCCSLPRVRSKSLPLVDSAIGSGNRHSGLSLRNRSRSVMAASWLCLPFRLFLQLATFRFVTHQDRYAGLFPSFRVFEKDLDAWTEVAFSFSGRASGTLVTPQPHLEGRKKNGMWD